MSLHPFSDELLLSSTLEELCSSLDEDDSTELDDKAASELELPCSPLDEETYSELEDEPSSKLELLTSLLLLLTRVLHLGPLQFGSRGFSRSKSAQESNAANITANINGNAEASSPQQTLSKASVCKEKLAKA
jgi:hypothetical protein